MLTRVTVLWDTGTSTSPRFGIRKQPQRPSRLHSAHRAYRPGSPGSMAQHWSVSPTVRPLRSQSPSLLMYVLSSYLVTLWVSSEADGMFTVYRHRGPALHARHDLHLAGCVAHAARRALPPATDGVGASSRLSGSRVDAPSVGSDANAGTTSGNVRRSLHDLLYCAYVEADFVTRMYQMPPVPMSNPMIHAAYGQLPPHHPYQQ